MNKIRLLGLAVGLSCLNPCISRVCAQTSTYSVRFLDNQKSFPKISEMMSREDDTLQKQFLAKQLVWPARFVYIRSFKYDSEMEVWVKNKAGEKYKLFKTYKICALAGSLGPARTLETAALSFRRARTPRVSCQRRCWTGRCCGVSNHSCEGGAGP